MSDDKQPYEAIPEEAFRPVLELLQGGDPDSVAQKAGITTGELYRRRDAFLSEARRRAAAESEAPVEKIGRNQPCPCGSGRKYKNCCLGKDGEAGRRVSTGQSEPTKHRQQEQQQLIGRIEEAFGLYASGKYTGAIQTASRLLKKYPNEDRLYDILANSQMSAGRFEKAIEICQKRLRVAENEKAYFIRHARYRDAEVEKPALSYYYPPMTWLQKTWIALKAREYHLLNPEKTDEKIAALVRELQSADDTGRFPEKHAQGMELRRHAMEGTIRQLKTAGPEVVAYLLPISCRYCWAGIFVPEILSHYSTDLAIRGLMDISMFGFSYASGASLHHLEQMGEAVVPRIEAAFSRDREFDPIKTGLVSVLGNLRTPAAYDLLIGLLDNASHHIVNWAGDALGKFGKIEALPRMMAAARRIGGEKMIDEAIEKLQDLA